MVVEIMSEANVIYYTCLPMQVNADVKTFVIDKDGVPRLEYVDTRTVGKTISTKRVGSWYREDITHLVSTLRTVQFSCLRYTVLIIEVGLSRINQYYLYFT